MPCYSAVTILDVQSHDVIVNQQGSTCGSVGDHYMLSTAGLMPCAVIGGTCTIDAMVCLCSNLPPLKEDELM